MTITSAVADTAVAARAAQRLQGLHVQTMQSEEAVAAVGDAWKRLQLAHGKVPFTDPALIEAWWRLRGRKNGYRLHVTTVTRDGNLVAVAPLAVCRRNGVRVLRWAGGELFDYCDVLTADDSLNAFLWDSVRRGGGYDIALIKTVHRATPTHRSLCAIGRNIRSNTIYAVQTCGASPGGAPEDRGPLPDIAKHIRRLEKVEKKQNIEFEVDTDLAPADVLAALLQQKTNWAAQRGKKGLFNDPEEAAGVVHALAAALRQMGILHLSWLRCGDQIIAVHLGCVFGGKLYYYMPSYDAAWSKYSPGRHLMIRLIDWASSNGLKEMDLLRGDEGYKAQMADMQYGVDDFSFAGSVFGKTIIYFANLLLSNRR